MKLLGRNLKFFYVQRRTFLHSHFNPIYKSTSFCTSSDTNNRELFSSSKQLELHIFLWTHYTAHYSASGKYKVCSAPFVWTLWIGNFCSREVFFFLKHLEIQQACDKSFLFSRQDVTYNSDFVCVLEQEEIKLQLFDKQKERDWVACWKAQNEENFHPSLFEIRKSIVLHTIELM